MPGELSILFRARLIQGSAKLTLMTILAKEKSLREKERYSYDLRKVLANRPMKTKYVYGFLKNCTKKFERAKDAESTSLALFKNSYVEMPTRTKKNIAAFFYQGAPNDCYDPKIGFEAFAIANLDPLNPARLDVWKINRDGDILNLQNGLPVHE